MGLFNVKFYIIRIRIVYKNLIFMVASFFYLFCRSPWVYGKLGRAVD